LPDGWNFSFDGEEDREDAIETAQSYIDANYEEIR
jgi:hypothetical protein